VGGFATIFKAILGGDPIDGISKLIEEFKLSPGQKVQAQTAAGQAIFDPALRDPARRGF
jgi:hypothetical protein